MIFIMFSDPFHLYNEKKYRCIYYKSCNSANPATLNQNCLSWDEVWIHPSSLLEYIHHSDNNEEPLYWNLKLFMYSSLKPQHGIIK